MPLALPGFANVHSHAFQRLMRGHVQRRDPGREDTFWTWRQRMFAVADALDLDGLEAACRLCFVEALEAGYTAVGEFHYLHHGPGGAPWPDPLAASRAVLRAARQAGPRMTLLWTVYGRDGFDAPLGPAQRRFASRTLDDVRRALDGLAADVDGVRTRLGLAIHSVRAVSTDWLAPLAEEAAARDLPLHVHASEQRAEVAACRTATGLSPIALLAREGALTPRTTVVHGTWLDDADVSLLARSGATVCVCPTTEGDLGDGVPRTADLHAAGVPLSIGSDSHAVLDPFAELRRLEYDARAATNRRCVLTDPHGAVGPALLAIGHGAGYRALSLPHDGDLVVLDTDRRLFAATGDLLATALTAGHAGCVDRVEVAGEELVRGGRHVGG